jgi:hypothetical protein
MDELDSNIIDESHWHMAKRDSHDTLQTQLIPIHSIEMLISQSDRRDFHWMSLSLSLIN